MDYFENNRFFNVTFYEFNYFLLWIVFNIYGLVEELSNL